MQEAYTKYQKESEEAIAELQAQITSIQDQQAKANAAYTKAVAVNQSSLDKLQAEVNSLNTTPPPAPTITAAPAANATPATLVTPQFLSDVVSVLSNLGLLTPKQMPTEQSSILVQQAVGQIQHSMQGQPQQTQGGEEHKETQIDKKPRVDVGDVP